MTPGSIYGDGTEINVDFYKGEEYVYSYQEENDFHQELSIEEIPAYEDYDKISIYEYFKEERLGNTAILREAATSENEPNDFEKGLMVDYIAYRGELLNIMIKKGELPKDICETPEAKFVSSFESKEIPISIESFENIYALENTMKEKSPDHYESYIDNLLDDDCYVAFGVDIAHIEPATIEISLTFIGNTGIIQYYPLVEMPTEKFLDHDNFVEKLTRSFNEYMPYASMQLHDSHNQSPLAMV